MGTNLQVIPLGEQYYFKEESDVVEIFYTFTGLRIVIETQKRRFVPVLVEIFFRYANGFRLLDEGDLIRYWESDLFQSNHHIYEVLSGGWSNGETLDDGLLSVSAENTREWFIVTTNRCITVIAGNEPYIKELHRWPTQENK